MCYVLLLNSLSLTGRWKKTRRSDFLFVLWKKLPITQRYYFFFFDSPPVWMRITILSFFSFLFINHCARGLFANERPATKPVYRIPKSVLEKKNVHNITKSQVPIYVTSILGFWRIPSKTRPCTTHYICRYTPCVLYRLVASIPPQLFGRQNDIKVDQGAPYILYMISYFFRQGV